MHPCNFLLDDVVGVERIMSLNIVDDLLSHVTDDQDNLPNVERGEFI